MSARKFARIALFLLIVASLLLTACGGGGAAPVATQAPAKTEAPAATEAPAKTEAPVATEAPAKTEAPTQPPAKTEAPAATQPPASGEKKVATFIWTQEFDTLNPLYTNMWFASTTFPIWNCYAWLFDDQNNLVPSLVKEIPSTENGGISADGKTITLKLRDDLKWSDGEPLTSADFKFTYDMTMADKNTVSTRDPYDKVEKFETPDATTVAMTFKEPYAPWAGNLWHGILPQHVLEPVFKEKGTIDSADWNKAPTVGCGPFNFAEWESGSFARFVANDNYWLGRPKLDEIFFRFVPDDASQKAALLAGDGDLGTFISYPDLPDLEAKDIKIAKAFSGYNEGWYFNFGDKGHPALKDVKVRQALAYGFNREKLNQDLLLGGTVPAATMWDNTPYVDPSIQPYPYDPEKAKALLDEAGWKDSNGDGTRDKDGVELVLKYGTTTREIRQDTQAVAQQEMAEIGVKLDLQSFPSDTFFADFGNKGPAASGDLDFFEYSTAPQYPDPNTADFLCSEIPTNEAPSGANWSQLCDKDLDALFQKQMTQVDFKERQQTFQQITKMIFDKVYWLGVWQDPDLWAVGPRLLNAKFSGATPLYNIAEWDLAAK